MRILVIGGNGFIGAPLVRQLRASGHQVAVFHRGASADHAADDVVRIAGDRNQLLDHQARIQQFSPQVVVDLILSSGEQAQQLVRVARALRCRVVAISSMDVYRAWGVVMGKERGDLEPLPLTEDSALRTQRETYPPETVKMLRKTFSWLNEGYDKIAVEEAVMNGDAAGTVVRLPMVYGPGDPLHRFFPLLKRIADARPAFLMADDLAAWRGPKGYVDCVAHGIALAATSEQARGRIYNICQEPSLSDLEWYQTIANVIGWKGRFVVLPREHTPKHLLQPGNPAQHVVVSSQRIRMELGYAEPVPLDQAIRLTATWENDHPPSEVNASQFDYAAEDAAMRER